MSAMRRYECAHYLQHDFKGAVGSWMAMFWYVSGRSVDDSSELGAERIYADFYGMSISSVHCELCLDEFA